MHACRLYTPSAYYTAKALVDIPLGLVNAIVFCGVLRQTGFLLSFKAMPNYVPMGAFSCFSSSLL